ncbi:MAG: bL35 family ribosomal protein [Patescibacteria group bacterium]
MSKVKTRKSISKRLKITKNGKVLHRSSFARHLRSKKGASQSRRHKLIRELGQTISRKIRKVMGR